VIEEDEMNAFSLPGGYVYIYKGLLDILDNDSELAFVLAHEVSHIVARHSIKKLQAALGYNLLVLATLPAEKSPQFYQGLSLALAQIMSGYSRRDELTADELAMKYIQLAGWSPEESIDVLEKLYAYNKKRPSRPLSYFRTHPFIAQRIKHIKEVLGIPLTISDYINE
jgi:predicted Zn-dependent protease